MNRWFAAGLTLALALGGSTHAQQDKIVFKDGKEKTVKIQSEDYDGLKLSVEGGAGSTTEPWRNIDSIRYGSSAKYQEALDAFNSGGPGQALPKLEELLADDKLRPVLRHGALYTLGLAQKRAGQDDKAIASFEALLKDFPKSRYLINVGMNLLSLYVAKGDPAGATKSLDATLKGAGGAAGPGLEFLKARILEEQKKYADAERIYQTVTSSATNDPDLALAAKLALGRCAQFANRANEAQTKYREIVAADGPNEVLAGAWNGLGDLALAEGTTKRDSDGLRYALFAYLRGVVLYVPERGGTTDEYERSLAGASKAFRACGELETDATKKKLFLTRAQQRLEQLKAEYPRSRHIPK